MSKWWGIRREQRRQIAPDELPEWLIDLPEYPDRFRVEHTQPVFVHPKTYYETLQLLALIGAAVGTLKTLVTGDAWIRTTRSDARDSRSAAVWPVCHPRRALQAL
jgi:hypothetical protein